MSTFSNNAKLTGIHSYQAMGWSPVELDESPKTIVALKELAVADDYEAYASLLPYNKWDWDGVDHEECDESYIAAMRDLAIRDEYEAYENESHKFDDELKQYAADLLAARAELFK